MMSKILILTGLIKSNFFMFFRKLFHFRSVNVSVLSRVSPATKFQIVKGRQKTAITIQKKTRIIGHGMLRASGGIVQIDEHCEIRDSIFQANQGNITIHKNCFFNSGCILVSCDHIDIGEGCAFGTNVSIFDHDHIFVREGSQPWNENKKTPVKIGKNCWIGCNVVILRGTEIGDNCVIGAGTVVKGKIPPHSLVYNKHETIIKDIV